MVMILVFAFLNSMCDISVRYIIGCFLQPSGRHSSDVYRNAFSFHVCNIFRGRNVGFRLCCFCILSFHWSTADEISVQKDS